VTDDRLEVLTVLRRTEQYLRKAGIESPRLDAEVLLGHVLGVPRISLYTGYDRPLTRDELGRYRELIRRRADREPVAYLTGVKEFYSLEITVTPAVLVPRPETEHLVDLAVELSKGLDTPRLLDVGTGSGCIAVAWATEVPEGRFVATDTSEEALAVARGNAERAEVADRGEFLPGDLYEPAEGAFDIVVSNPPYVGCDEEVDPECRAEPELAVFSPGPPEEIYRRLLEGAPALLRPGGHLILELPGGLEEEIRALIPGSLEFEKVVKDYAGLPRVLVAHAP